jgi:hypothetical protein
LLERFFAGDVEDFFFDVNNSSPEEASTCQSPILLLNRSKNNPSSGTGQTLDPDLESASLFITTLVIGIGKPRFKTEGLAQDFSSTVDSSTKVFLLTSRHLPSQRLGA